MYENCRMQGSADPNVDLMGAAAFMSRLVPDDSVGAFLAAIRQRLCPGGMFSDLFRSGRGRLESAA
ncbi:MAG: hypothetical protein ACI91Q_002643 [Gammaproteobacteria bacterium]|jgi:hypothetical protein